MPAAARRRSTGSRRELREETGVEAGEWREIGRFHLSNSDQRRDRRALWRPGACRHGRAAPEPTEELAVRWVPFDEALAMTLDGRITDAMSIIGIQRVALERAGAAKPAAPARTEAAARDRDGAHTSCASSSARTAAAATRSGCSSTAPRSRVIGARPSPTSWASRRPSSSTTVTTGRDPDLHAGPRAAVRRPPDGRDGVAAPRDRHAGRDACGRRPATSRSGTTRNGRGSARRPGLGQPRVPVRPAGLGGGGRRVRAAADGRRPASTSGRGSTRRPASVRSRYFPTDFGIAEDEATGPRR